jgi:hypothetical protein
MTDTRPSPRTREEHNAEVIYISDRKKEGYRLKKWHKDFYGNEVWEWEVRK